MKTNMTNRLGDPKNLTDSTMETVFLEKKWGKKGGTDTPVKNNYAQGIDKEEKTD
jgi:hypothetical protein